MPGKICSAERILRQVNANRFIESCIFQRRQINFVPFAQKQARRAEMVTES